MVIPDRDKSVHPMKTEMPKGWTSTRRAPASMSEGRFDRRDRVPLMTLCHDPLEGAWAENRVRLNHVVQSS